MQLLRQCIAIVVCGLLPLSALAFGNEDVMQLLAAGMSEEIVLKAINTASPASFDTSAKGLIALKKAGASDVVIQQVIARQSEGRRVETNSSSARGGGRCALEAPEFEHTLSIRAGGRIVPLTARDPGVVNDLDGMSAVAHFLTFGIAKAKGSVSMSLAGERATTRTADRVPELLDVLAPLTASPEKVAFLVRLTAKDNRRTVQLAEAEIGLASSSTQVEIGGNARVPLVVERVAETCAWKGQQFSHYRMKPSVPLAPGEYGALLGDKIFDFAVD